MIRFRSLALVAALGLALPLVACGTGDEGEACPDCKPDETGAADEKTADGKADAWNSRNNPSGLGVEMEYGWALLDKQEYRTGAAENKPWPDTYWPTYEDSTNVRWQGNDVLSPMEKYDAAFNDWDPAQVASLRPFDAGNCGAEWDTAYYDKLGPAAKYQSANKGNRRTRDAVKAGNLEASCRAKADGACMKGCENKPAGAERNQCESGCHRGGVETWWGLCHAWAPAAILEKEPLHPVEYNGQTFTVGDIKGLITTIYDRSNSALIGGRCNDWDVKRDEDTGRIINSECRDLNAGSFHVVMVNLLGIQKRGFVEDRTYDYQVWNQPVAKYEVHSTEEIPVTRAHELLKVEVDPDDPSFDPDKYAYNTDAAKLFLVDATLYWITESQASTEPLGQNERYTRTDRYKYIVEVDASGEVIGGEWLERSITNHPDFVWLPFQPRGGNPYVDLEKVHLLNRLAQEEQGGGAEPTEDLITVEASGINLAIPDNKPAGVSHTLDVGDAVAAASGKASIEIEHTYIGDLVITLTGPGGKAWTLHNKEGGSTANLTKSYPLPDLPANIAGAWTLKVADTYARDIGKLVAWRLDFGVGEGSGSGDAVDTLEAAPAAAIPDNSAAGVTSTIESALSGGIRGLEVSVNITHTYISDLEVTLKKDGVSKVLHQREGGSADNLVKTWSVTEFGGASPGGTWSLSVRDMARLDKGTLNSWSLKVTH